MCSIVKFISCSVSLFPSPLPLPHTHMHTHTHTHTNTHTRFTEVCEPYEGYGFCHGIEGYRDGNWTVYVDRSPYKWGPLGLDLVDQFLEGLLPQLTEDVGNETWSPGCDHAVRQLLCHATLLFCEKQGEQGIEVASYPGVRRGERMPGTHCLRMRLIYLRFIA